MTSIGNSLCNSIWEVRLNSRVKPTPQSTNDEKERWIRAKYERREFVARPQHPERPLGPVRYIYVKPAVMFEQCCQQRSCQTAAQVAQLRDLATVVGNTVFEQRLFSGLLTLVNP